MELHSFKHFVSYSPEKKGVWLEIEI